jgi:hypothetical protein
MEDVSDQTGDIQRDLKKRSVVIGKRDRRIKIVSDILVETTETNDE